MFAFTNLLRTQRIIQNPVRITIRNWHKDPIPVSWEKPQVGWTKLNFDGSCKGRPGRAKASIGGVFRNHKAEFLLGYAESIGNTTSSIAELAALTRGLELVLENGWNNVWLEGDAKTLVEIILQRRKVKSAEIQRHVSHINLILPELDNCIVSHVYREGNRAADKLAQIGHQLEKPQVWWHIPPDDVLQIVHEDAQGKIIIRKRVSWNGKTSLSAALMNINPEANFTSAAFNHVFQYFRTHQPRYINRLRFNSCSKWLHFLQFYRPHQVNKVARIVETDPVFHER